MISSYEGMDGLEMNILKFGRYSDVDIGITLEVLSSVVLLTNLYANNLCLYFYSRSIN